MGAAPEPDLESAGESNIALNHLIRAEVRAAVKAEVKATISAPPAYSTSTGSPSDSPTPDPENAPIVTPTDPVEVTPHPVGWPRTTVALAPWLIIFVTLPALCLTVDKQGISTLAFALVLINFAALAFVLCILALVFKESFKKGMPDGKTPFDPANAKIQNFALNAWFSWWCLVCVCAFGGVLYSHFFLKKGAIGQVYGEVKQFEGMLGVDGAMGMLVQCLQGRVDGSVKIADVDVCFGGLGVRS